MRIGTSYGFSPVMRSYMSNRFPYFARHGRPAQPVDRVGEVEVDAQTRRADATLGVAHVLRGAAGDVARDQVAERRVLALQEVVALVLGDVARACGRRRVSLGTHTRPSLRSDSLISVSFDWCSPLTGMQVGWIWV